MYLLDTNVVSELRRPRPHGGVISWLESVDASRLHIAAVTLGEMQRGVERTRRQDAEAAEGLERWIDAAVTRFSVIPMDGPAFRQWARLVSGRSDTLATDAMIAATALVHGLVVVTRNVRDFVALGMTPLNPFEYRA